MFVVCGVPHCGNRYVLDLLLQAGAEAQIIHPHTQGGLQAKDLPPHTKVIAMRNPYKCFLTWWKNGKLAAEVNGYHVDVLDEVKYQKFLASWRYIPLGEIFRVDRDDPFEWLTKLGLQTDMHKVQKHNHVLLSEDWVTVNPAKVPHEVQVLARQWGYSES